MTAELPERKAARAARQKISHQQLGMRGRTKKPIAKEQSTSRPAEDLLSPVLMQSRSKSPSTFSSVPRSKPKAKRQSTSELIGQKKKEEKRRRLNSDMELPKEFVAANKDKIYNVDTLDKASSRFQAAIREAEQNPGTTPQKMAELLIGLSNILQGIRLQLGVPSPPGTPRLNPEADELAAAKQLGLDTSATSIASLVSNSHSFGTQETLPLDFEGNGLAMKSQRVILDSSRDPAPILGNPDLETSNSKDEFGPPTMLHRQRLGSSKTQLSGELMLQWGKSSSATATLVEVNPQEFKQHVSKQESKRLKQKSQRDLSHATSADCNNISIGRQSSDESALSEANTEEMAELVRSQ
jgi:hypothetical protein